MSITSSILYALIGAIFIAFVAFLNPPTSVILLSGGLGLCFLCAGLSSLYRRRYVCNDCKRRFF